MSQIRISIRTSNDAFHEAEPDNPGPEAARVLREIAQQIEDHLPLGKTITIMDVNGNRIGQFTYTDEN